jgi:hypothetical protein
MVALSVAAAVWVLYGAATSPTRLSVAWGVALGAAGIALTLYATSPKRRFITPLAFALFFDLGFVVAFGSIARDPADIPKVGFGAIGRFDFTDGALAWPAAVIGAGIAGILVATWLAERALPLLGRPAEPRHTPRVSASVVGFGWLVLGAGLVVACGVLGLGRTGLTNETVLPFAIGGLLVYLRDVLAPALAAFALMSALREGRSLLALGILLATFLLAVLGSLAAASRGHFVIALLPAFILVLQQDGASPRFRRLALPTLAVFILTSGAVMTAVNGLRDRAYSAQSLSMADSMSAFKEAGPSREENTGWTAVASLATDRVGGMRELLAISGCRLRGAAPAWALISSGDVNVIERIEAESFGFVPLTNRSLALGVGFGFWGAISLLDNVLVVLFATILLLLLPLLVEAVFLRFGERATGQVLAALLALALWGQPSTFGTTRFLFVALLTLGIVAFMRRSRGQRGRDGLAGPEDRTKTSNVPKAYSR